jgi:hypothetical protein
VLAIATTLAGNLTITGLVANISGFRVRDLVQGRNPHHFIAPVSRVSSNSAV